MSSKTQDQQIIEFIENQFNEYTGSTVFNNWKLLCDNINDACEQRYRPGEQLTRQGLYFGVMRAQRDGWRESAVDAFGQAKPLFSYKPKRGVDVKMSDKVQEVATDIWTDIDGLQGWLALWNDAVDFSMAIAYTKYCHYVGEVEKPVITKEVWGDMLEWQESFETLMDSPDFIRVHPYNYRCGLNPGPQPAWEGCEWEWGLADLHGMLGDKTWNQAAVKRIIDRMVKGECGQSNSKFHNVETGAKNFAIAPKVYAKEYWGKLNGMDGNGRDPSEYVVVVCEGEVLRKQMNKMRIGRKVWRPLKRIRLDPMNDLPIGAHVMAATLTHSRMKNLMLNLTADDIVIRQHLGLAVWRGALENPNQLLNPEGAREPLFMRKEAGVDKLPRFFADNSSGVARDAMTFDSQVTERDLQISGMTYQSMGLGGGAQGKTATEQNYLANSTSRKMRSAIIMSCESGLKPIVSDLLGLYLRNNTPEDLRLSPQEHIQIFLNNMWEMDTSLTSNMTQHSQALAQWGSMALQKMSEITPANKPGSADHVVRYLKDTGKALGLSASAMDLYLPEDRAPQIQTQQPPMQPGQPQQPQEQAMAEGQEEMTEGAEMPPEMMQAMMAGAA